MKKIVLLVVVVLLSTFIMGCSGASTQTEESESVEVSSSVTTEVEESESVEEQKATYDLKWYTAAATDQPATLITEEMIQEIEENSDGRIKITLYSAGSLANEADAFDMLRTGTIAFMTTGPSIMQSYYEPIAATTLPFLFKDSEHAYKFYKSDFGQQLLNETVLGLTNVRTIAFRNYGYRVLTTNGIAVNTPEDLNGVKIRSMDSEVGRFMVECLGATPVPVAFAELYVAMQTGVVTGQENPIANIVSGMFYEVQDHVILTNHQLLTVIECVNEDVWQAFSDEDKQIILDALDKYMAKSDEAIEAYEQEGLALFEENGVVVIDPDIEAFRTRALEMIKEKYVDDPEVMEIINEIEAAA
ncbi:MAG: TRAP transporter substrate-binding protein [Eubacteriales bacterium]|nr:TRAP transporter substrate-binding protein [Eubacteriales bacterium]